MNKSQKGYSDNIESETINNDNYRKVLYTGKYMQLVVMSLLPGEEIGAEVHDGHDQFFRIEQGSVTAVLDGEEISVSEDEVLIVPSGVNHNVINSSDQVVKLYTIYSPPEHPDGTVQATKTE